LTFPNNRFSPAAEDLIRNLLTDPENRFNYDAIRAHPFFADVDFDNIHQSEQCRILSELMYLNNITVHLLCSLLFNKTGLVILTITYLASA
jgi:serine/threonine protein kinase